MKGLKKKLVLCVATAFAGFLAFMFPFGFVPVLAEESENTANYEAVLGAEGSDKRDSIATLQNDGESQDEQGKGEGEKTPSIDEKYEDIADSVMDELAGIIPETEFSLWFKEKILPYILQFLAVAGGALFSFLLVLKKLNITLGDLINACNVLRKANKDSEETKAAVQAQDNKLLEWTASQAESMKEWQREQKEQMQEQMRAQAEAMAAGFAQIAADVTNKLDDAVKTVHKILDVEEIAYQNNPAMVSQGTTAKIEEVIHNGTEKKYEPDNEG